MSIAYSVVTKGGTQVSQLVAVRFKIGGGFNARHDVTNWNFISRRKGLPCVYNINIVNGGLLGLIWNEEQH